MKAQICLVCSVLRIKYFILLLQINAVFPIFNNLMTPYDACILLKGSTALQALLQGGLKTIEQLQRIYDNFVVL